MSVEAFFREFDGNSTITKVVNDSSTSASRDYLTWNGSDVIINYSWTLPVPILLIGSTLSYSFDTKGGDIEFSVGFISAAAAQNASTNNNNSNTETGESNESIQHEEEVLQVMNRVPSDTETVEGKIFCRSEGMIRLTWNNEFSWFLPKWLSYNVQISPPLFRMMNKTRTEWVRSKLIETMEENRIARKKLKENRVMVSEESTLISKLRRKLERVRKQHEDYQDSLVGSIDEANILKRTLLFNTQKMKGLTIRCLKKPVLAQVLSFLPVSTTSLVSKYWNSCSKEKNVNNKIPPVYDNNDRCSNNGRSIDL
tara:strand:- start:1526 stop:2458 length:933 start_codon:yes stop_codon:yes gene_type:complete